MVVIVSYEADFVTSEVIKNLIVMGVDYIRLGESQFVNGLELTVSNSEIAFQLNIGGRIIRYADVSAFWFRKNDIEIMAKIELKFSDDEVLLNTSELRKNIFKSEIKSIREFLFFLFEKKRHLGKWQVGDANKLISFCLARECGLLIPSSFVSTNSFDLKKKIEIKKVIIKAVEDGFGYVGRDLWLNSINQLGNVKLLRLKEKTIFPSLVQDYIEKKIELRVFYFRQRFFTMAIFSQSDEKTKVDFRNYNDERPNRMVPYNLPINIEKQIDCFMKRMGLFTGSLDFVLTPDNNYVFLEVNPVGQYGMVGRWNNVDLDKLIARYLAGEYEKMKK